MALITCPECKKEVSEQAESCPQCGYGIRETPKKFGLDQWVKIAQISLPGVVTIALAVMGMFLTHSYKQAEQKQIKAETAIKVVDLLKEEQTKEAAALLALSFFREGQLQSSVIPIISTTAARLERSEFRDFYVERLKEMKAFFDEHRDSIADPEEFEMAINKALRQLGDASVPAPKTQEEKEQAIEEDTGLLGEAASHVVESVAKKVFIVDATETEGGESKKKGKEGEPEVSVATKVAEITEKAIGQVSKSREGDSADKEAGEEAIKKTNALLQAAVGAKKDAKAEGENPAGDAVKVDVEKVEMTANSVVQKVLEQSLKELPGEENIELREKLFEDTNITRLVVVIPIDEESHLARAQEVEKAAREILTKSLKENGDEEKAAEVVSAIDKLWLVEKEVETNKQLGFENELRYLKDQPGTITRKTLAEDLKAKLESGIGFRLKLDERDKGVAKGEYEIWVIDASRPEERASNTP